MLKSENIKKILLTAFVAVFYVVLFQYASAAPFSNTVGDTTISSGFEVSGEQWVKDGDITISTGGTLQINPGSSFQFEPGYKIKLDGGQIFQASHGIIRKGNVECECISGACCDGCHYRSSTFTCRASAGVCDIEEKCSGSSDACPTDNFVINNSQSTGCDGTCQACQNGVCGLATIATDPGNKCAVSSQYQTGGDPNFCQQRSYDGLCNASGSCNVSTWSSVNNGLVCASTGYCTGNDYYGASTCLNGTCTGSAVGCCAGSACSAGNYCRELDHSCQPLPACQTRNEDGFGTLDLANGTACVDDGNPCTADTCQAGSCTHTNLPAGTTCGAGATSCSGADTCNASGVCQTNNYPNTTDCGICAKCNGFGSCAYDSTQNSDCASCKKCTSLAVCSNQTSSEDLKNDCTGNITCSGSCSVTSSSGNCDGFGSCATGTTSACPAGTTCIMGVCAGTDTCTYGNVCSLSGIYATCGGSCGARSTNGTTCASDSNTCTTDICSSGSCSHAPVANGTACADDGNPCTVDSCQAGTCSHIAGNAGTVCRASQGACDAAETCTGSSTSCPPDTKLSGKQSCSTCQYCNGSSNTCAYVSSGSDTYNDCSSYYNSCSGLYRVGPDGNCNGSGSCNSGGLSSSCNDGNACTNDSCSSGTCLNTNNSNVCRASQGPCDIAENCSGGSCPADSKLSGKQSCSTCQYCSGSSNSCSYVSSGSDTYNECSASWTCSSCYATVATGNCNGSGSCQSSTSACPPGTSCSSGACYPWAKCSYTGYCSSGSWYSGNQCDGNGSCSYGYYAGDCCSDADCNYKCVNYSCCEKDSCDDKCGTVSDGCGGTMVCPSCSWTYSSSSFSGCGTNACSSCSTPKPDGACSNYGDSAYYNYVGFNGYEYTCNTQVYKCWH